MCSTIPQVENIVYITFLNLLHKKTLQKLKKKKNLLLCPGEMPYPWNTVRNSGFSHIFAFSLGVKVTPRFMFNTFCQVQRICIIMVAIYSWFDVNFNYLVHCLSRHFRNFSEFLAQFLIQKICSLHILKIVWPLKTTWFSTIKKLFVLFIKSHLITGWEKVRHKRQLWVV